MATREGVLNKNYYQDFGGGVNSYLGPRQIKDNESPDSLNCDFVGKGGVKNREGYSQISTAGATYDHGIYGMGTFKTAALNQLIKFASDGANVVLNYSTGGAWTAVTGTKFTDAIDIDVCQAMVTATAYLFMANGTDTMVRYTGSAWEAHTGASKGYSPVYYAKRLWIIDETNTDTLNYSTEYNDATKPLDFVTNGTTTNPGTLTFLPGSGQEIVGIIAARVGGNHALYVFLKDRIYMVQPNATNTWTATLVTGSIGCVARRSICAVGDDIFFAADDGVYSLGEVAQYTNVRTTNKSARVSQVFANLSGAMKKKLVGRHHNFKYHLFYSLNGTTNDSCLVYDTRYNAWQDWRNMGANDAIIWTNTSDDIDLYFGHPTTGAVYKMYSGSTDDGTAITSSWYSKSFDEGVPDVTKLYFDSTFLFGNLSGTVNISIIFNDSEITVSKALSQAVPQGGLGRTAFGRAEMTPAGAKTAVSGGFGVLIDPDTVTSTNYIRQPLRIRAKGQKFAAQYKVSSSGQWELDSISQTFIPMSHYKFPSNLKIS